ncbi:hypothetical protein Vadar_025486 [Vaccinium darrowii]|uniref:Uncharacterized protein n=1 Tax=Vaccinium darrowii TaxID=229202 RepID=A0ACB7Z049_9ERIC|nr:hypothetical protein Vadar_025486 [Vaccinium darrowii]
MASRSAVATTTLLLLLILSLATAGVEAATWCVARSDASEPALQKALDYACGAGADCAPIQPSGQCYLPNTVQSHASYAFNSYYQWKANAPDSCGFSGTATASKTDPSYGSCVYPSSPSTAGGTGTTTTIPSSNAPPPPGTTAQLPPLYGSGGLMPGLTPLSPVGANTNTSKAAYSDDDLEALTIVAMEEERLNAEPHRGSVQDEREDEAHNFEYERGDGPLPEPVSREHTSEFMDFIRRHHSIRNRESHSQLQSDLVEHLWERYSQS